MADNGEWRTMGNGGQWGMADNWEWQTMGDENILETTDTGE